MFDLIDHLRASLIVSFEGHYALNDTAHRVDHFEEVFETGCFINAKLGLGYGHDVILAAAYLHDLFAWSRKNHHELSYEFVKGSCHPWLARFTPGERWMIALACRHHRASFKGRFRGKFDELINSADRGMPKPVKAAVDRAIKYRESRGFEGSREVLVRDAVNHIKEKYGSSGYARYPEMYRVCFADALKSQQDEIDHMDYRNYL